MRTLPPTAAPIPFQILASGLASLLSRDAPDLRFKTQLRSYFGVKHVFLFSSGKAALFFALASLRRLSARREVVIPAYASFCLASAVARTRLPVKLCDIDPATLDFDLDQLRKLVDENTLAVIPVHNHGLVCNLREIKKIASESGAFVLEDAAQGAGASFEGRKVGVVGDAGILSLGRGKNICALGGGVVVTENERIAGLIASALEKAAKRSRLSSVATVAAGFGMCLFLNPSRYSIPAGLPFLNLGANVFDPEFELSHIGPINAEIGSRMFQFLDEYNVVRIRNAGLIRNGIAGDVPLTMTVPEPCSDGKSVYLRFPVLFKSREDREKAYRSLKVQGLGASCSYPSALDDIAEFRKCLTTSDALPGAGFVAKRILTLPTHSYLQDVDISRIVSSLHSGGRLG